MCAYSHHREDDESRITDRSIGMLSLFVQHGGSVHSQLHVSHIKGHIV